MSEILALSIGFSTNNLFPYVTMMQAILIMKFLFYVT